MLTKENNPVRRLLGAFLGLSLCLSFLPRRAEAQIGKKVQIQIGKPSVWSMGQAHYLLAGMRQRNRQLGTKMPDADALDPNAINATSIRILKTLLDIRGEYNQKIGAENASARREESYSLRRREEARRTLAAKQNEMEELEFRSEDINGKLARLRKEKAVRDAEREADETQPTAEDRARDLRIADLESTLAAREAEKTKLAGEITALETKVDAAVGPGTLKDASIPGAAASGDGAAGGELPGSEHIDAYIRNSVGQVERPSLAASIALDNFIGMQYEIIAKQLTLLRDEIGADERIVFLELPSSIYTVPGKADDYVIQLRWAAKRYYDSDPTLSGDDSDSDTGGEETEYEKIEESVYGQRVKSPARQQQLQQERQQRQQQSNDSRWVEVNLAAEERSEEAVRNGQVTEDAILRRAAVRALDVIPRQSALNINETYATVSQFNFLGVLKLLSGIGLQVNYQRQRQLYEQFLQQEVFASGFGKGRDEFGWTFGPQPGTKRVAPGVRTTYAVLAVPRYASALDIEVEGVAYPRKKSPDYADDKNQLVTKERFLVRIPNEITERFWVDEVEYTPVKKGGSVTMHISGRNFSPQTGVLVNSVPLARALSLANNETADALSASAPASGLHGAFELLSTRDIMLTFNMGDPAFVGTPTITLVTPERTKTINGLPLDKINNFGRSGLFKPRLRELSSVEPMFTDGLSLKEFVVEPQGRYTYGGNPYTYVKGRLYGAGMLPGAEIEIDGRLIPPPDETFLNGYIANEKRNKGANFNYATALENAFDHLEKLSPPQEYVYQYSTGEYRVFARARNPNKFEVRYRHKSATGFDTAAYKFVDEAEAAKRPQLRRYLPDADRGRSLVDLRIGSSIPPGALALSLGPDEGVLTDVKFEGENSYRAVFLVNDERLGAQTGKPVTMKRDTITVTVTDTRDGSSQSFDVALPVQPEIVGVVNPRTGKATGLADEEPVVTLSGRDLQQVRRVFFGEQEATIVGGPSFDSVEVKVPKRDGVADGEKVTVSVRVVTGANKASPASHYTFLGKTKPPAKPPKGKPEPGGEEATPEP